MNRMPRPRNGIQAKAYAANAAIVIGMTVAGMVTMRLFRKASPMPFDADDLLVVLQRPLPCSNGWIRAVHQPVWVISWGFRKELTNSPAVGRVHRKQMTMTEMRSGRLWSIGARQNLVRPLEAGAIGLAGAAITSPPDVGSCAG